MSKKRRVLTFVAALALYALAMPISAFAATPTTPTTIKVGSSGEFDDAAATVNAATSGEYIIELTDDISPTIFKLGESRSPLRSLCALLATDTP